MSGVPRVSLALQNENTLLSFGPYWPNQFFFTGKTFSSPLRTQNSHIYDFFHFKPVAIAKLLL